LQGRKSSAEWIEAIGSYRNYTNLSERERAREGGREGGRAAAWASGSEAKTLDKRDHGRDSKLAA